MRITTSGLLVLSILAAGCSPARSIDSVTDDYQKVAPRLSLGDNKTRVLSILEPLQQELRANQRKQSESFLKDGKRIEIYYMRTGRQPDGLTTDDEFTPYVFENGVLVAIGWSTLGGPKTFGRTRDQINVEVNERVTIK